MLEHYSNIKCFEPSVPIKAFFPKLPFYTKEILLKGI